jgi:rubrerythrin
MDAKTVTVLQDIIRRESRSLLQYVSEAFPWITAEEQAALAQFQKLAEEQRTGLTALTRYLTREHQPLPYIGPYPDWFTTINYVSWEYLLPHLVSHERESLTHLEHSLAELSDATARERVQTLVDMKRRHLQTLEALAAAHPQTASTVN